MEQQRQRYLAKQPKGATSTDMPLLANQDLQVTEVATPMASAAARGNASMLSRGSTTGLGEMEVSTPTSAANISAKMEQQRQRYLAKQRQGATSTGIRVLANQDLQVTEAATPMAAAAAARGNSAMLMSQRSTTSLGEMQGLGSEATAALVVPDAPPASKEEEAERRNTLNQDLMNRGILPVFDPTPMLDAGGGAKPHFDMAGLSGQSEMRAFLHDPCPRNAGMIQCRIVRDRTGLSKLYPKYKMESEAGVFMMCAQKQKQNKTSNYAISMLNGTVAKDCEGYIGKLRSDFMGLEFVAYGPGQNPAKASSKATQAELMQVAREELVAVQYSSSLWGSKPRGPRKMSIVIPRVQANGERLVCRTLHPEADGLLALHKGGSTQRIDPYQNKNPKWNEQIGAYVLNFNKRVTQASVKNFQLTSAEDPDTVYLQFGRVDKDVFNIDFRFPMSPFQAFAICLSSFDYKLCCE